MFKKPSYTNETFGPLMVEAAKEELLKEAKAYAAEHNCSILVGMGMVESQLKQRLANLEVAAKTRTR